MTSPWRRITVFVSSTFKDMEAERDALKFDVKQRLDERLRRRSASVEFVDLRIGINTEEMGEEAAEDTILEMCFDNIDRSRPFFLGLIGARYGWVPSQERWDAVVRRLAERRRALIGANDRRSVTELEILYGVIGADRAYLDNAIFFMRDPASYANMTDAERALFDDASAASVGYNPSDRLAALKQRIAHTFSEDSDAHVVPYTLTWDPEEHRFIDINAFADAAYEKLSAAIEAYLDSEDGRSDDLAPADATSRYLLWANTDRKPLLGAYHLAAKNLDAPFLAIVGPHGSGKKVVLSQLCAHVAQSEPDAATFIAYMGADSDVQTLGQTLGGILMQMQRMLGYEPTENARERDCADLEPLIRDAARELTARGRKPWIFIADVDYSLRSSASDIFMPWASKISAHMVVTACTDCGGRLGFFCGDRRILTMPDLTTDDRRAITEALEQQINISLPTKVRTRFAYDESLTPLQMSLLMTMIGNFSQRDIADISSLDMDAASDVERINAHLTKLIDEAAKQSRGLASYVTRRLVRQLGFDESYYKLVQCIALSGVGLHEADAEALIPGYVPLKGRILMHMLHRLIYEHPTQHFWNFSDPILAQDFVVDPEERRSIFASMFGAVKSSVVTDPIKPYYAISSGRPLMEQVLSKYYLPDKYEDIYRVASYYLFASPTLVDDLRSYSRELSADRTACLVGGFFLALPIYLFIDQRLEVERGVLSAIEPSDLAEPEAAMRAAWAYSHLRRVDADGKLVADIYFARRAHAFFHRCYQLDPDFPNARQLAKAAAASLLPLMMQAGEPMSKITELYTQAKQY